MPAESVDFGKTFALTSRPETFRQALPVLALAVRHNLHSEQLDTKSALLHAKIKETTIIRHPKSSEKNAEDGTNPVCKLNKSF